MEWVIGIIGTILVFTLLYICSPSNEPISVSEIEYDKEQQKLVYPSQEILFSKIRSIVYR